MVATEKSLHIDECCLDPLPIINEDNLIANAFRIRLIESLGFEPGSTRYFQYQKLTKTVDEFLENYPAESGEVIVDFNLPGFLRLTIIKP